MNFRKLLGLTLLCASIIVSAEEPNNIILVTKDKYQTVEFTNLKPTTLKTINHHPSFIKEGIIDYQGYLFKDLFKNYKIKPDQAVLLIATTGQFVLELKASELLNDDVIVATIKNGKRIETKDFGNQIIYGSQTIEKNPVLKNRHYWLWWVRSVIIDDSYKNDFENHKIALTNLESQFPFPKPDGESTVKQINPLKNKVGKILDTKKASTIKITLINDSTLEIPVKTSFTYFLTNSKELKAGGETLHVVEVKNNKITNIVASHFYIKQLTIIR